MGVIRDLPPDQIDLLLRTALVGRIACCDHRQVERPHLVPLAYGYDGHAIYAHSGPGRKIALMRAQPLVTFEVDQAEVADRWRSVIVEATYEDVIDPMARRSALRIMYPPPASIPVLSPDTVVYRLVITAVSGRYEEPEE